MARYHVTALASLMLLAGTAWGQQSAQTPQVQMDLMVAEVSLTRAEAENLVKNVALAWKQGEPAQAGQPSWMAGNGSDKVISQTVTRLQQRSVAKVMAQPKLITLNGQLAHFLAGGQIATSAVANGDGEMAGVSFTSFGQQVCLRPTIGTKGRMHLEIALATEDDQKTPVVTKRLHAVAELGKGRAFLCLVSMTETENTPVVADQTNQYILVVVRPRVVEQP